ncbi:MAG: hypothetical protein R3C01_07455 [Planctomycetaceae bacterium]
MTANHVTCLLVTCILSITTLWGLDMYCTSQEKVAESYRQAINSIDIDNIGRSFPSKITLDLNMKQAK